MRLGVLGCVSLTLTLALVALMDMIMRLKSMDVAMECLPFCALTI